MTTKGKWQRRLSKAKSELALEMLLSGKKTLHEMATELGVPLGTIASWALQPCTVERILSWIRLNNARTLLLTGPMRTNVAVSLYNIASAERGGETARKACVDFLKFDLTQQAGSKPADERDDAPPPRPMSEDSVRRALEMLGGLPTDKEAYRP